MLELCDKFFVAKATQRDAGELRQLTWLDYKRTAERVVAKFGRSRLVDELRAEDFEELKAAFAKTMGPVAIGNEVNRVRVMFKYAYDAQLMIAPMRFGPLFRRPSRKVLRVQRANRPSKVFAAAEIHKLLAVVTSQMRAMILLATNGGLGNNDCAKLEFRHLDLSGGWLNFPRQKTGINRRCKLWPQTVAAIRAALAKRRTPQDHVHANLVFITAACGTFAKETTDNPITKEFAKALAVTKLTQSGRNFYGLRHTFRKIADGAKDTEATRCIMGHVNEHVEVGYVHFDDDARLEAVTDHVRKWLFTKPAKRKQRATGKSKTAKPQKTKDEQHAALRIVG